MEMKKNETTLALGQYFNKISQPNESRIALLALSQATKVPCHEIKMFNTTLLGEWKIFMATMLALLK